MIKIMDTSKTLNALVNDRTNGLGQINPINAFVTEELNGVYEAELSVPSTDKHFNDLAVGGILKIPVSESNEQLFRINAITKPMDSICLVECSHITYDLNKVAVQPFTATGSVAAVNGMVSNIIGSYPFTMTTNINNTQSKFTLDIPRSFRECLGGYEGSLLDVFRGEYEYDNLTVKMLAHRGRDNGVRIAYGKNLTSFTQDEQMDNVFTSVLGYAIVDNVSYVGSVYHKVQATYPKVKIVDFSTEYETGTIPTTADLTAKAQAYALANSIEVPKINMEVSFVPLDKTEEYKNIAPLERVSLGDTVHIYFEKLGVEGTARVIRTEWNVLTGRYESVELGEAKANLNTLINESVQQVKTESTQSQGYLEDQMDQMASLIINGLGLHRTLVATEGGGYRMYLHNKSTLTDSDTQYIFTAEGFLVSTDYGQTWNAGFDSQGNAILNSLATITLKALEINGGTITGSTIIFGNPNGTNIIAQPNQYNSGILFDGSGEIEFNSVGEFKIINELDDIMRAKIFTDMQYNSSTGGKQNGYRMYVYDQSMTASSDPWYTTAASISMLSRNQESSGGTDNNALNIEVLDGVNNKRRAGIYLFLNKNTNKSSMSITTFDTDGETKKADIQMHESGEIDIYSAVGVWINGTRVGG